MRSSAERLYYLDWLRVIAFAILLFEHCAEVFVTWHFWVKNPETSLVLTSFIAFFKPWRMPLLFFISGAAVTLSFKRRTPMELIKERTIRILLPLIAAMFLVIPPQVYLIKLSAGDNESFATFYQNLLHLQWFPKGNFHWLHLWYLAFIFAYTLVMLPVLEKLKTPGGKVLLAKLSRAVSKPYLLFSLPLIFAFPYYISQLFLGSENLGQVLFYFPFFIFGTLLGTSKLVLDSIRTYSKAALISAIVITCFFYSLSLVNEDDFHYFFNMGAINPLPVFLLKSFNQWFWLIAVTGMGMRYLNYGSPALTYATQAVYPFYILHQTVIVVIAYYAVRLPVSIGTKLLCIMVSSFILILLSYEYLIKRTVVTRLLFGLKVSGSKTQYQSIQKKVPGETIVSPALVPEMSIARTAQARSVPGIRE